MLRDRSGEPGSSIEGVEAGAFNVADVASPYGQRTQHIPNIKEVHILWITAGLGCDGDTVSITAASEPSIEDVVLGAIPGLPKVHLHNPVLAYTVGDEFMKPFHQAARGELENFVLVLEGSIPNEKLRGEGYWAAMGTDPQTGQPITTNEWIDRLAPKALAVVGAGTCATYGGIHAMEGNPTGCMGLADYLGLGLAIQGGAADRERARAARCSRTISWRRCFIFCGNWRDWRR